MLRVTSLLLIVLALSGCARRAEKSVAGEKTSAYETLELRYQGGSGYVSFPELAADLGYLAPIKLRWGGNTISGPQDIQTVVTNDIEFGAAFNGSIIKLIEAKAPIRAVIGMSSVDDATWTGFYVLDGSPIRTARDFLGKKVAMNTVGAHSEFMLREYLARGGLSKAEIDQVTLLAIPPVNSEQVLRQKQVDVATLGGILRDKALERGGIHPIFRDYDLFGEFTSASYVLRTDFIAKNPNSARKIRVRHRAGRWTIAPISPTNQADPRWISTARSVVPPSRAHWDRICQCERARNARQSHGRPQCQSRCRRQRRGRASERSPRHAGRARRSWARVSPLRSPFGLMHSCTTTPSRSIKYTLPFAVSSANSVYPG